MKYTFNTTPHTLSLIPAQEPNLIEISQDVNNKNPMLVTLKQMIQAKFKDEKSKVEGRGIIFVQTREMTQALRRWMMEDDDLRELNPEVLVGANAKDPGPSKKEFFYPLLFDWNEFHSS